jgi:hypothetical protein
VLSRKDFYNHLMKNDCEINPFEGVNRTANQIEIINKKHKERKFYLSTPFDERVISSKIIEMACARLGIPLPSDYK